VPEPLIIKKIAKNNNNIRYPCHILYRMSERNIYKDEIKDVILKGKCIGFNYHKKGMVYVYLYNNIKVFVSARKNKIYVVTAYKMLTS
jgi:hypothetical protein